MPSKPETNCGSGARGLPEEKSPDSGEYWGNTGGLPSRYSREDLGGKMGICHSINRKDVIFF